MLYLKVSDNYCPVFSNISLKFFNGWKGEEGKKGGAKGVENRIY
jgi:hypothetical protein